MEIVKGAIIMRWKKVSKQAKLNKDFIDSRYKVYSTPMERVEKESVESFLNRGGKIIVLSPKNGGGK